MICLIRQSAGLGDIFFCQKIGYYFLNLGYKVIWPVINEFSYIKNYMNNFEYINQNLDFSYKEIYSNPNNKNIIYPTGKEKLLFVPLHGHELMDQSVMKSKYKLVGLDYSDWQNYFNFKRNTIKENELYYNVLKLKDNEEYIFINKMFASPPGILYKNIQINTNKKIVELKIINEFTIFDWCKVLENASEIYSVDTAINYIMEKLNLKTTKLELFSRYTPTNYFHIINIYRLKWNYNY